MTSDGISSIDWDRITGMSAEIANAAMADNDALVKSTTQRILKQLDALEKKYGKLPSILATKAEYVESANGRVILLQEAWRIANEMDDKNNLVLISSSLAQLYIEDFRDFNEGEKWLTVLGSALENKWDEGEYSELNRLMMLIGKCTGVRLTEL